MKIRQLFGFLLTLVFFISAFGCKKESNEDKMYYKPKYLLGKKWKVKGLSIYGNLPKADTVILGTILDSKKEVPDSFYNNVYYFKKDGTIEITSTEPQSLISEKGSWRESSYINKIISIRFGEDLSNLEILELTDNKLEFIEKPEKESYVKITLEKQPIDVIMN